MKKIKLKLVNIINEIYPQTGGQGDKLLYKDLMPHIKGIPGTEDIQDWLNQNGEIPEYMIPRLVKDPKTLKFLKNLIPQIKQQALQRKLNPQKQKEYNPYSRGTKEWHVSSKNRLDGPPAEWNGRKIKESVSFEEVKNLAQQILKRWGNNPRMIMKAAEAAGNAAENKPQQIFPANLDLGPERYIELADILRNSI